MAVKNKRRAPRDAAAFARWVEEQAATDDWIRAAYEITPEAPSTPRLPVLHKAV